MDSILLWLLDPEDPAVRARTLLDLLERNQNDPDVLEAKSLIGERGSASRALAGLAIGQRDMRSLYRPKYGAPYHRLVALAEMGVTASHPVAGSLLDDCLEAFFGPAAADGKPADAEVCLVGNLSRAAILMGRGDDPRVEGAISWLVSAQLPDGGWHCWPEKDPHGTPDAWEALGAFAAIPAERRSSQVRAAAERGVEFFLRESLGMDDSYEPWRRLHFPRHYYYDVLIGLELATSLGNPRDKRLERAKAWLRGKRGLDGRWHADAPHPDLGEGADYAMKPGETVTPLVVETANQPSKWLTLSAMRVIRRANIK